MRVKEATTGRAGDRRYMGASELARRWDISLAHAYRMFERGDLPSVRFGGAVRTPIAAVEAYEEQGAA